MESFKIPLAIIVIAAFFILLPQIFSFAFSGFGGVNFGGGTGTLREPEAGQLGVLAISFNSGNSFDEAKVHNLASPNILAIEKVGSLYFAGTDRGLLISKNSGLDWYPFTDLEKQIDSVTAINGFEPGPNNTLYISAYKNNHGVVYVTHDNFFTVTPIWEEGGMPVTAMIADRNFLYVGLSDGRLLRYSFSAGTFQKVDTFRSSVGNLVFTGGNLFVGLDDGRVFSDAGTRSNFSEVGSRSGLFFVSRDGLRIVSDAQNQRALYLASLSGIFQTVNQGASFREINSILPENADITALAVQNGKIFATVDAKLYKSEDGGATWKIEEPLPTNGRLSALFVGNGGAVVVVGTSK